MKTAIARNTTIAFPSLRAALGRIPNPVALVRAQEQLYKFRALDAAALRDAGLTQEDVDRTTLADFMNKPR